MFMFIECDLCPKRCRLGLGQRGQCRVRSNVDGKIQAVTYGYPVALHLDPMEKKPLFHFLPGSNIFSVATVGCNLHCKNCQNWEISQANFEDAPAHYLPPEQLIEQVQKNNCASIAYTYTEPLVSYEYIFESAQLAHEQGIKNVLVTAGYANQAPLKDLFKYIDAANIDLKGMSDQFYRQNCSATLAPVLDTIVLAKQMGLHLEITNLIIPTMNDSDQMLKDLVEWICENLGKEHPLHFSRFYPHHRLNNIPATPESTLQRAFYIAQEKGLKHVYIGNLSTANGENTYCPDCHKLLVERKGYRIIENRIQNGKCSYCQREIYGQWGED